MRFDVLTLFPDLFEELSLRQSIAQVGDPTRSW